MVTGEFRSQWENLLLNTGIWDGSFTGISPEGEIQTDRPTRVAIDSINQNTAVRQTIEYFSAETNAVVDSKVLEYSSLSRSVLFFDNGAFSQGSIQYGPFGDFGAEIGFIEGDRRMRLVQLFRDGQLTGLTLIREHRQGSAIAENPPLTVEQLVGTWQGEAVTLYPDWRTPETSTSTLTITRSEDGTTLHQRLTTPSFEISSAADIGDRRLQFNQSNTPVQVLLLPDGASSNTPLTIPRSQPFLLEAGWLIAPDHRQRIIRSYDAQGGWSSLTLVSERKMAV